MARPKKRPYDMTLRAAHVEGMRQRILSAAVAVYGQHGFTNTTMQAVAKEAKVAPTTVLNHFATPDSLMTAAIGSLLDEIRLPQAADLEALTSLDARMRRLASELAGFFERSQPWYRVYARESDNPILRKAAEQFFGHMAALVRAALGPELGNARNTRVVAALLRPEVLSALRAGGLDDGAAVDTIADVLLAWLGKGTKR
jgi:AcrR family transcriptional regulator